MLEQPLCPLCAVATSWSTVFSCYLWFIVPLAVSSHCSFLCQVAALPPTQLGVKVFHPHLAPLGLQTFSLRGVPHCHYTQQESCSAPYKSI